MTLGLAILLLLFSQFSVAQAPSQIVTSCPFSSTSNTTSFNLTYYYLGQLNCTALTVNVTMPDSSISALNDTSCTGGVHSFSVGTASNGFYLVKAYGAANTTAQCDFARLRTPSTPPSVPDLPSWLAILLAPLAFIALKRGKTAPRKP